MKQMKAIKKILTLCAISVLTGTILLGCGKKIDAIPDAQTQVINLNRGQYIEKVEEAFGMGESITESQIFSDVSSSSSCYNAAQTCAEWEIIPAGGEFKPNDPATLQFAIETAVKAIGVEKINKTNPDVELSENNLLSFYKENIADIDVSNPGLEISNEVADQILEYAVNYQNHLVHPQRMEYDMAENAYEITDGLILQGDGSSAILKNGENYKVGDVIYVPSTETSEAVSIKIKEIDGNMIKYEPASLEDTFDSLEISGEYELNIIGFEAADSTEVSVIQPDGTYATFCNSSICGENNTIDGMVYRGDEISFSDVEFKKENGGVTYYSEIKGSKTISDEHGNVAELSGKGYFKAGLYNFKADVDVDFKSVKVFGKEIPTGFKQIEATLTYDELVEMGMEGNISIVKPLGKIRLNVTGTPISLVIDMKAHIGADGSIKVSYTADGICYAACGEGKSLKTSMRNENDSLKVEAKAKLVTEATILADLQILTKSIVNAEITSGVAANIELDADILSDEPVCLDIHCWVPLRYGINQKGCLATDINKKWKKADTIWDSENSKFQEHYHYEDMVLVDACTRGTEKEVEAPSTTEEGKPLEEYTFFEFEEIDAGIISLVSQKMYLENGQSLTIGIAGLPEGYTLSDLQFTPLEAGICTINSGGVITAVGEGTTVVEVSTNDGKYKAYLNVVVNASYTEFENFEPIL